MNENDIRRLNARNSHKLLCSLCKEPYPHFIATQEKPLKLVHKECWLEYSHGLSPQQIAADRGRGAFSGRIDSDMPDFLYPIGILDPDVHLLHRDTDFLMEDIMVQMWNWGYSDGDEIGEMLAEDYVEFNNVITHEELEAFMRTFEKLVDAFEKRGQDIAAHNFTQDVIQTFTQLSLEDDPDFLEKKREIEYLDEEYTCEDVEIEIIEDEEE